MDERINKWLDALELLVKQYSSDVLDTILAVVQITGIQQLVFGVITLLVFVALNGFAYFLWTKKMKHPDEDWDVGALFMHLISAFPFLHACIVLFNIWNWVAVFNPKLYLAYKIFSKLL